MVDGLEVVKRILDDLGVEFFLEYGTCLGIYRDGNLLEGDHDIDIGIYGRDRLDEVREALKANRFEILDPTMYLSVKGPARADIHFYEETHSCYQCWVKKGKPYLFFPKRFRELGTVVFMGNKYNIPKDTEGYLEWVYGDWKDKNNKKSAAVNWKTKQL